MPNFADTDPFTYVCLGNVPFRLFQVCMQQKYLIKTKHEHIDLDTH